MNGITGYAGNRDRIHDIDQRTVIVKLSYKMLLPLLGNLTEGERLVQNFKTATTIVHELCVSASSMDVIELEH